MMHKVTFVTDAAAVTPVNQLDVVKFQIFVSVINSQHISPAIEGRLHAVARIVVKADFKHVWDVEIKDDHGKLISISRVTNSVKPK